MTDEKTPEKETETVTDKETETETTAAPEAETETETETEAADEIEAVDETETEAAEPTLSFDDLNLKPELLQAMEEMGFKAPLDVQAATVPLALEGKDLLVQSRTGSGKTAAFGIPMVQQLIDTDLNETQALVLSPTRELAIQVCREIEKLSAHSPLKMVPVYGGAAMEPQTKALRAGVHLVVGTPGRVLDHIRRKNFNTSSVKLLVLDEGDEMLSMGFLEEISKILDNMPEDRQTLLFSATIPDDIKKVADRYMKDPESVLLSEDFIGVREITHLYYLVSGGNRLDDLIQVLEYEQPGLALIFCNTKDDTANVAELLRQRGYNAEGISSDLSQDRRERVMGRMRKGEIQYLVATDVAARGIDLPELSHVINYTFPESADVYVHRTGRTGRAGKKGRAVSLIAPRELGSFYYLKLIHKIFPEERHLPTADERFTRREAGRMEKLQELFEQRGASEELMALARRLWSTMDGERLVALALAATLEEFDQIHAVLPEVVMPEPQPQRAERSEEPRRDYGRDRDRGRGGSDRGRGGRDRDRGRGGSDRGRGGRDRDRGRGRDNDRGRGGDRKTTRTRGGSIDMPGGESESFEFVDRGRGGGSRRDTPEGQVRIYLSIGREHGTSEEELSNFVCEQAEVTAEQIHRVDLQGTFAFANVAEDAAEKIIEGVTGTNYGERRMKAERAKSR